MIKCLQCGQIMPDEYMSIRKHPLCPCCGYSYATYETREGSDKTLSAKSSVDDHTKSSGLNGQTMHRQED